MNLRTLWKVAGILWLAVAPAGSGWAEDWPTAAHDAARTGRTSDAASPPYRQLWVKCWPYENIATVAQLVVAQGRGYMGTVGRGDETSLSGPAGQHLALAGRLRAISLADGADVWSYGEIDGGIVHCVAWHPHAGGTVVAATTAGEIIAADAATGELRWKYVSPGLGGFSASPCLAGDTILIGDRLGVFHAMDLDGHRRWTYSAGAPICQTAAAADGVVYFTAEDLVVRALEIATGKPVAGWSSPQLAGGSARDYWPVVAGEHVLVGVAPPHKYNWHQTDAVLFQGPAITSRKQADYSASAAPEQEAAEQKAIQAWLAAHPHDQVLHCLDRRTGRATCTPGIFYTGGSGSVNAPAVVTAGGQIVVEYRTYYSLFDSDGWHNPFSALGTLDPATGVVTQLRPNAGKQPRLPWGQIWIIADESSAFTLSGDLLLVAHQGNFGGMRLPAGETFAGIGRRDTWGGQSAQSFSRQEWHGGPRSPLTVSDGKIYYVTGASIIAVAGKEARP